ncbi:hypothetical protein [Paracoccus acridae]|nr:hypothetical protein [Paracoccus acridae]
MTSFTGLLTKIDLGKGSRFYCDASFEIAAQETGKSIALLPNLGPPDSGVFRLGHGDGLAAPPG